MRLHEHVELVEIVVQVRKQAVFEKIIGALDVRVPVRQHELDSESTANVAEHVIARQYALLLQLTKHELGASLTRQVNWNLIIRINCFLRLFTLP
jgi:hypothetical protein